MPTRHSCSQSMEYRFVDRSTVFQMLSHDPLEQRWSHAVVPHSIRVDDDDRPLAAHAETRSLATFDPSRTEEEIFALQQFREE